LVQVPMPRMSDDEVNTTGAALANGFKRISYVNVAAGIERSLDQWQQSIKTSYYHATKSPQPGNIYKEVLLACALAAVDDLRYFTAAAVRRPLRLITGREYEIPNFAKHLKDFSDPVRWNILSRTGEKRRLRYRFNSPIMRPYIIMHVLQGRHSQARRPKGDHDRLGQSARPAPAFSSGYRSGDGSPETGIPLRFQTQCPDGARQGRAQSGNQHCRSLPPAFRGRLRRHAPWRLRRDHAFRGTTPCKVPGSSAKSRGTTPCKGGTRGSEQESVEQPHAKAPGETRGNPVGHSGI
jgi:hypothetical protein